MAGVTDFKVKKTIKACREIAENRKCFDCGANAPTYVNITVATFICQTCSGIVRELNHRVKGVNMSKFTKEDLEKLKNGGNKVAASVWRPNWDSSREPLPQGQSKARVKSFMENTYVHKKYRNGSSSPATKINATSSASAPPRKIKAKKQQKQQESSEEEESDEEESEEESEEKAPPPKPSGSRKNKQTKINAVKSASVDLLSFDDVTDVSGNTGYKDPWQLMQEQKAAERQSAFSPPQQQQQQQHNGFGGGGFDNSPFGASSPAAAPAPAAAAVNPFASPGAPTSPAVNPFLAQLGMTAPVSPASNPFGATAAPTALPVAQNPFAAPSAQPAPAAAFNPFLDPPQASAPPAARGPDTSGDAVLAMKLQQQLLAEQKQQEAADHALAMQLQNGNGASKKAAPAQFDFFS